MSLEKVDILQETTQNLPCLEWKIGNHIEREHGQACKSQIKEGPEEIWVSFYRQWTKGFKTARVFTVRFAVFSEEKKEMKNKRK